jgi:hypothetical protein
MMKDDNNKVSDYNSLGVAIESLRTSIARLTEKGELHISAVPGLSLFRRSEPTEPISPLWPQLIGLTCSRDIG